MSTDGLGAEAVLKLTGVSVGLNEMLDTVARLGETGTLTTQQVDKLSRGILALDKTAKSFAGTVTEDTAALSRYAAGFEPLIAKMNAFAAAQRLAAQAGVVSG